MKAGDPDSGTPAEEPHRRPKAVVVVIPAPIPHEITVALAARLELRGELGRDASLNVSLAATSNTPGRKAYAPCRAVSRI